jgi:hypothetical protein
MQTWQIAALAALGLAYAGWYGWTKYGFHLRNLVAGGNKVDDWEKHADAWIIASSTCKAGTLEDRTEVTADLMGLKEKCREIHAPKAKGDTL